MYDSGSLYWGIYLLSFRLNTSLSCATLIVVNCGKGRRVRPSTCDNLGHPFALRTMYSRFSSTSMIGSARGRRAEAGLLHRIRKLFFVERLTSRLSDGRIRGRLPAAFHAPQ
jgi:hypothetical protein